MSPAPQRYDLVYDNADQLIRAPLRNANNNNLITNYLYGFDLASNRISEKIGTTTTTSTPNTVNEIVSQSGGINRTLSYDYNGSLTSDGLTRTFEWDAANRLTAINYPGTTNRSEFTYDGLSRCVKIVEKTNSSVTSTRKFVWCGNEKCEFRDENDAVTLTAYPQGQRVPGANYFYFRDHLGSIREMMKSNGTLVARFDYDPWGRSTTMLGTALPDFNFTGLYRHSASNLDFAVYRVYDPDLGRWLSRDPLADAERSQGPNLYVYVGNGPVLRLDQLGLDWVEFHPSGFQPTPGGGTITGNLEWHDTTGGITSYPVKTGGFRGDGTLVPPGETTALPNGNYSIYPDDYIPNRTDGYRRDGVGFSFRLNPNFTPEPMRTDLLIHPDGGPPGTAGCLGLQGRATALRQFESRLLDYLRTHPSMSVNVYKSSYP